MPDAVAAPENNAAPVEGQTTVHAVAPPAAVVAAPPVPVAAPVASEQGPTPVVYDKTGDIGLDMALDFIGARGIPENDPAMAAALDGDFSLLKAKLAGLGDAAKGWEQFVALAEKSYADNQAASNAAAAKTLGVIHELVGGEQAWASIKEFASKNAAPAEKEGINAMLSAGGVQARAAALLLKSVFEQQGTYPAANPAKDAAPRPGNPPPSFLTRREAVAEVNALVRRVGSSGVEKTPEYAAIMARVR